MKISDTTEYSVFAAGTKIRYKDVNGDLYDMIITSRDDSHVRGTCKPSRTNAPSTLFQVLVSDLVDAAALGRVVDLADALEADASFASKELTR